MGILAGGILGPLVTVSLAFALGLAGVTIDPLTPWAEIVWSGVFAVTFAAAGAWAVARWLPRDFKAATETYLWLAVRAEAHWHELFGDAAVPRSRSAMRAFIAATPETPETAGERFGIWMALGDLASARRVIEQMPDDTGSARHARASATWLVDLAAGSPGDLAALRSTAAALDDPDERLEAEVEVAVDAARVEVAAGRDWKPPLVAIRERLGPEPTDDPLAARLAHRRFGACSWRPSSASRRSGSSCRPAETRRALSGRRRRGPGRPPQAAPRSVAPGSRPRG